MDAWTVLMMEKLIQVKEKIKYKLLWKINVSNASLWWDNWTGMRAIGQIISADEYPRN